MLKIFANVSENINTIMQIKIPTNNELITPQETKTFIFSLSSLYVATNLTIAEGIPKLPKSEIIVYIVNVIVKRPKADASSDLPMITLSRKPVIIKNIWLMNTHPASNTNFFTVSLIMSPLF